MSFAQRIFPVFLIVITFAVCLGAARITAAAAETLPVEKLPTPAVTAKYRSETSVTVSWNDVPGAERYVLFMLNPGETKYTREDMTDATTYIKKGLDKDTTYKFKVAAIGKTADGDVAISEHSEAAVVTTGKAVKLPAPQLTAETKSDTGIVLNWTNVKGAERYVVYMLYPGRTEYTKIGEFEKNTCTKTGLVSGARYRFQVAAIDVVNGKTATGAYSNTATAVTIDNAWAYFLVNKTHYLPGDFTVNLSAVQGEYAMDARAAPYAREMIAAAKADGIDLVIISAYRSLERQRTNFADYVNKLVARGYSHAAAVSMTSRVIAPPGASEHNAALALDIVNPGYFINHTEVTYDFDETAAFRWLSANAHIYGFIMRYAADKTEITGFIYEPWHYRFVGKYYAEKIYRSGLCLEEFIIKN